MQKNILFCVGLLLFCIILPQVVFGTEWEHITHVNGEEIDYVNTVKTAPDGSIIFGGKTGIYEANGDEITKISGIASSYAIDSNDNVYVSNGHEIIKISKSTGKYLESPVFTIPDSFPFIYGLAVDSQNNIWVAGYPGVACIKNTSEYQQFTVADGLFDNYIHDIHIDSSDRVWVCYGDPILPNEDSNKFGGVSMYSDGVWTTYNESDGLLSNRVFCIESNSESVFISYWGANGGISVFTDYTWSLAPTTGFFNLFIDRNNTLWYHLYSLAYIGYLHDDGTSGSISEPVPKQAFYYDLAVNHGGTIWVGTADGIMKHPPLGVFVGSDESKPEVFEISAYPNPFNPSTTISYTIPEPGDVALTVYNLSGQKVATLVDSPISAGTHQAVFDGSNLASGMYFYRFESGNVMRNGKMMLVK